MGEVACLKSLCVGAEVHRDAASGLPGVSEGFGIQTDCSPGLTPGLIPGLTSALTLGLTPGLTPDLRSQVLCHLEKALPEPPAQASFPGSWVSLHSLFSHGIYTTVMK